MAVLPNTIDRVVQDMGKSLAFYRLLGLEIPEGLDGETNVEITTPNGYVLSWSLEAMMAQVGGEKWKDLPGRGRIRLSFQCDTPAEVDAVYARMVAAGHVSEAAPWNTFWGQRFAQLLDPDGCLVDIFAPLSGESQAGYVA